MDEPDKVPSWDEIEYEKERERQKKKAYNEYLKTHKELVKAERKYKYRWMKYTLYYLGRTAISLALVFLAVNIYSYITTGRTSFSPIPTFFQPKGEIYNDNEHIDYRFPDEVDGVPIMAEGSLLPGEYVASHPYVKNEGEGDMLVYLAASYHGFQPDEIEFNEDAEIVEANSLGIIPAFIYELNEGWEWLEDSYSDGTLTSVYVYTKILSPGDTTTPLCNYMQLIPMTFKTYADITDDELNISYNTSIVDATALKLDSKDAFKALYHSTLYEGKK